MCYANFLFQTSSLNCDLFISDHLLPCYYRSLDAHLHGNACICEPHLTFRWKSYLRWHFNSWLQKTNHKQKPLQHFLILNMSLLYTKQHNKCFLRLLYNGNVSQPSHPPFSNPQADYVGCAAVRNQCKALIDGSTFALYISEIYVLSVM